jgi:hypothetical protein
LSVGQPNERDSSIDFHHQGILDAMFNISTKSSEMRFLDADIRPQQRCHSQSYHL